MMTPSDSEIKLILLDFDGTLADTRRANTLAYVATLREAGYALTEQEYAAKYFGMRCSEFLTRLGIHDAAERERLRLRKIALYPSFFDTVRLNRPLWEFCQQFRAQGGRVWIVSTGSRANIENVMNYLGITTAAPAGAVAAAVRAADATATGIGAKEESEAGTAAAPLSRTAAISAREKDGTARETDGRARETESMARETESTARETESTARGMESTARETDTEATRNGDARKLYGAVDGILTGADVAHSKPAPDCFLEAMRREGCTPRQTLIFEDSEIGLEAARRSGASYFRVRL